METLSMCLLCLLIFLFLLAGRDEARQARCQTKEKQEEMYAPMNEDEINHWMELQERLGCLLIYGEARILMQLEKRMKMQIYSYQRKPQEALSASSVQPTDQQRLEFARYLLQTGRVSDFPAEE